MHWNWTTWGGIFHTLIFFSLSWLFGSTAPLLDRGHNARPPRHLQRCLLGERGGSFESITFSLTCCYHRNGNIALVLWIECFKARKVIFFFMREYSPASLLLYKITLCTLKFNINSWGFLFFSVTFLVSRSWSKKESKGELKAKFPAATSVALDLRRVWSQSSFFRAQLAPCFHGYSRNKY